MEQKSLEPVRAAVRGLLEESPAYRSLDPQAQTRLAHDMVQVSSYLADPGWLAAHGKDRVVRGLASDPIDDIKRATANPDKQVAFDAKGVRQGVQEFGNLVKTVDFPAFVSGLVKGVFNAVVDASIQQMQAYGEMLSAVAKTAEQFAQDNVSDGQVRDHIRNRYPSLIDVDTSGPVSRLKLKEGADESSVDLGKEFNLDKAIDLSDEDSEAALIAAAKVEIGRQRQQLMATKVLLGIKRIVVTDGKINAKVVFEINASDQAKRTAKAALHDEQASASSVTTSASAGAPWASASASASASQSHTTSVSSSVDDTSESKANLKAQLTGEVHLAFKSETFPLERMVDTGGMALLADKSKPSSPRAAAGKTASSTPSGATK